MHERIPEIWISFLYRLIRVDSQETAIWDLKRRFLSNLRFQFWNFIIYLSKGIWRLTFMCRLYEMLWWIFLKDANVTVYENEINENGCGYAGKVPVACWRNALICDKCAPDILIYILTNQVEENAFKMLSWNISHFLELSFFLN